MILDKRGRATRDIDFLAENVKNAPDEKVCNLICQHLTGINYGTVRLLFLPCNISYNVLTNGGMWTIFFLRGLNAYHTSKNR